MWTRISNIDRMFGDMDQLRSRMNRLFSDYDQSYGSNKWQVGETTPPTNLYDNGDQLEIRAEVPGLAKEDLNIKIQGNYLELSGSYKSDAPEGYKTHRLERDNAIFTRSFTLPIDVDAEKAEAHLSNGILTLTLPKAEATKPKQIEIN